MSLSSQCWWGQWGLGGAVTAPAPLTAVLTAVSARRGGNRELLWVRGSPSGEGHLDYV